MNLLIAHVSDTHLGAAQFGLKEREDDCYEAFNEVIDLSIREGVSVIVHSGDIFDNPRPTGTSLAKFADSLQKLRDRDIPFLFTLGEHDISRMSATPSALLFEKIGLAKYIGRGEPKMVKGINFVGFYKHRRTEVADLINKLNQLHSLGNERSVLVLHQALFEAHKYAGEISVNDLPRNFSYYAMGHLHDRFEKKFDILNGLLCYPGSTDPTGVEGVESFEKGFYIVDFSSKEVKASWVKLESTRPQLNVEISYESLEEEIQSILASISKAKKKPVVRLGISGSSIDPAVVSSKIRILLERCLYCDWQPIEKAQRSKVILKPVDMEEEVLRIAKELLENEDLAYFAVKELLPLLEQGRTDEAEDLLWQTFERRRFDSR